MLTSLDAVPVNPQVSLVIAAVEARTHLDCCNTAIYVRDSVYQR